MTDYEIDAGYDYQSGKEAGWEEARIYYKDLVLRFLQDFGNTILNEDIEELFELPEDEMELLRKAALNMGHP
jgi:hypothetical protein